MSGYSRLVASAPTHWISLARELGLLVMLGVMVETGIGRTAAAQLAPLADWLDIDPPDSIPADPLIGFRFTETDWRFRIVRDLA